MAVGGLQSVMRRGAFSSPASVTRATQRFREEADPVRGFIRERITQRANAFTARTDVYNAYVAWGAVNGFAQLSAARFYESFNAVLAGKARPYTKDGTRGYKGIVID
jgi:phage/plasmid-associated DNA primase